MTLGAPAPLRFDTSRKEPFSRWSASKFSPAKIDGPRKANAEPFSDRLRPDARSERSGPMAKAFVARLSDGGVDAKFGTDAKFERPPSQRLWGTTAAGPVVISHADLSPRLTRALSHHQYDGLK